MRRKTQAVLLLLSVVGLAAYGWWDYRELYRAREAALKQSLHAMRDVLGQFQSDRGRPPGSLAELVRAGYLGRVPTDPFTGRDDTWIILTAADPRRRGRAGVVEVRSGSGRTSLAGEPLSRW